MPKLNFSNYFLSEADNSTHVMTFMRANPITIGHERVVNQVQQLANDLDADHSVILSHSHDGDKNPLTPEQKLRHARIAFPGVNVRTSSPEAPSLLHHVAALSQKGVRNLHLVVGQDRVDQFNTLLNKYNHVDVPHGHGLIDLDNITVHSAGGRDPDAEGVEGISGSLQRDHVIKKNFQGFRAGAPSRMNDNQVMDLYKDIEGGIVPKAPKKVAVAKAVTKPKSPAKKPKFNPGTAVYVQHGSHSAEPVKESKRISFRELIEKKTKVPAHFAYDELMNNEDYTDARDATVNHLQNANDHIAKGGSENVAGVLEKHYTDDNPHAEHLEHYSSSSYETNMDLYGHHQDGGDPNELPDIADHEHIEGLDKALNHNKTKKPMTVYSGVGFHPGQMADQHPNKQLYMPAYTSTSIDPKIASSFARALTKGSAGESIADRYNPDKDENGEGADHHMLRINLPKGHPGAYIAGSSYHPEEKEFLLPRQQTMKINPTPEIHEFNDGYTTHRMHIWDASPDSTKLPKPIKENTTTADVRGFGYVTGDPAIDSTTVTTNDVDASFFRGSLKNSISQSENPLAKMIGFKSFNPEKNNTRDKTLSYYNDDPNAEMLLRDKLRNKDKNNNATKG